MILIAIGADASANNLGKIVVKSIDDISAETASLLSYFGKAWTDEQKVEIDNFFELLNLASWKSKIKILVMPILMPATPLITVAQISATNSIYKKNLAPTGSNFATADIDYNADYGLTGVNANGFFLATGSGGTFQGFNGLKYKNISALGIKNKKLHYGIYYKSDTKFSAGGAGNNIVYINNTSTQVTAMAYNSFKVENKPNAAPFESLLILNGDVNLNTGKTWLNNALVSNTFVGTAPETTISQASIIDYGNANTANDSNASLMTFGEYMTDSELTEYGNMINKLMDALIVN